MWRSSNIRGGIYELHSYMLPRITINRAPCTHITSGGLSVAQAMTVGTPPAHTGNQPSTTPVPVAIANARRESPSGRRGIESVVLTAGRKGAAASRLLRYGTSRLQEVDWKARKRVAVASRSQLPYTISG
ncbi:hypothetical protein BV20DRAFT_211061 [Pilatotrama ljubarskyi]|nr:hypothetical protein BV20DRAFT_211061 [Pilatotrama ljubarskyi]